MVMKDLCSTAVMSPSLIKTPGSCTLNPCLYPHLQS